MNVTVCFNLSPALPVRGELRDLGADAGAGDEAQAVARALRKLGHRVELLPLGEEIAPFVARLDARRPDVVFNLCEGFWSDARQEMNVAGLFELLRLPFTGSRSLCLGLTQDKARTKSLLLQKGLPTPNYQLVPPGERFPAGCDLAFPLIVKPRFEDASQGIDPDSVVDDLPALQRRIAYVHGTYGQAALVEEFIDGRELNVSIIGDRELTVLPISEIEFDPSLARPIVCFDGKWNRHSDAWRQTRPVCPARLTSKQDLLIRDLCLRAFKRFDCRDYARVDIRLRDGSPYILEVNANPDISPEAGLARSAKVAGIPYPQLIAAILAMALDRQELSHAQTRTH